MLQHSANAFDTCHMQSTIAVAPVAQQRPLYHVAERLDDLPELVEL